MKKYKLDIELHISCFLAVCKIQTNKKVFASLVLCFTVFENRKNISV